jgi:D-sedoheptulose 7-phosphate isomerase
MLVDVPSHVAFAREHLEASAEVKRAAALACADDIVRVAQLASDVFRNDGRIFLCGNGGSAADCQHIAAEFVSTLNASFPRRALGAIALTTDTSFLTANANDFGFEHVFARQLEALGRSGDLLIGITTSGNSANVLRGLERAREIEMHTVAFTGASEGALAGRADVVIRVPSRATQFIQEAHIALGHIMCDLVERTLFGR